MDISPETQLVHRSRLLGSPQVSATTPHQETPSGPPPSYEEAISVTTAAIFKLPPEVFKIIFEHLGYSADDEKERATLNDTIPLQEKESPFINPGSSNSRERLGELKRGWVRRTVSLICLSLTSKKFYELCRPYWQSKHPDFSLSELAFRPDHYYPAFPFGLCACGCEWRYDVPGPRADIEHVGLPTLLKDWMGPRYVFVSFYHTSGIFVDREYYGSEENGYFTHAAEREALEKRWTAYATLDENPVRRSALIPSPLGQGDGWVYRAISAMFADVKNHYHFSDWQDAWRGSYLYTWMEDESLCSAEGVYLKAFVENHEVEMFSEVLGRLRV